VNESDNNWAEANQRYLMARLAVVRNQLSRYIAHTQEKSEGDDDKNAERNLLEVTRSLPSVSALDSLCAAFALSAFERDLLLLCAGVELDAAFGRLCGSAQGDAQHPVPTFSLALAALPDGHWSALTPTASLRRWHLIEVGAGDTLTSSPLRIDERVLHYLTGLSYLDARLLGLIELVPPPTDLPPSHRELAQRIADLLLRFRQSPAMPVINLCGDEHADKRAVAAYACATLGMKLHTIRAADIPVAVPEREGLARLWEREATLSGTSLLLNHDEADNKNAVLSFIENVRGPLFLASREPLSLWKRPAIRLDVNKPSAAEQRSLWQESLGSIAPQLNGQVENLVSQFNLGMQAIHTTSAQVLSDGSQEKEESLSLMLWDACRVQARSRLDDLAQRIDPAATWDDLVLPESQLQSLRDIAAQVHQRTKVYEHWGFASKGARGLGISALFAGASGTGKTMAAEVLANELRLDLYRIDLSQVVSKYIGETEKNLRRVFDAAEQGGAVLLFDEADALFGKRSEVKDSHDRYANIEISYLLQRMEAYRGLAILTTNIKSVLDTAFLRRIRFSVQFPFPDAGQRARIWQSVFPASTPTDSLDMYKLARLNVAGGNIRNIALTAAFLAAHSNEPVRMTHLLCAARSEYAKLEKPLSEAESRDWI
jgi:ATP-dependent 26S proteasome regulatory subunit